MFVMNHAILRVFINDIIVLVYILIVFYKNYIVQWVSPRGGIYILRFPPLLHVINKHAYAFCSSFDVFFSLN